MKFWKNFQKLLREKLVKIIWKHFDFTYKKVRFLHFINMSGWPSGLRRQTQELDSSPESVGILVLEWGRGFESHFWQQLFYTFSRSKATTIQNRIVLFFPGFTIFLRVNLCVTDMSSDNFVVLRCRKFL